MAVAEVHPSAEELAAFTLGTLSDEAALGVEAHVAACPSCQERAAATPGDSYLRLVCRVHAGTGRQAETVTEAGAPGPTPGPLAPITQTAAPGRDGVPSAAGESDRREVPASVPPELARHERYRVVRLLGQGGMGAVYEAEHRLMQRPVALKVIHRTYTANPNAVERFRREVRAAARLSHPNIVATHDAEDAGGTLFLVMEYVDGVSLGRLVKDRGPLPVAEACACVRQAALGLQHAHEKGMVHRDVKPDNLVRCPGGTVKVLDFGLAVLTAERGEGLTSTNVVMGTPDYMAPEQAEDPRSADVRADVYSLGCTLFHLLTGKVLYPAETAIQKILAHREQPLPALRQARPEVPSELAAVVARMLAKKPADRYQTPAEVAAALEPFTQAPAAPPRKHRPLRAILAAAALFAGLLASAVVYRIQTDEGELVLTTESDDVEVVITRGGKLVRIIDTKTDKQIALALHSGVYELELKGAPEGLKLSIDRATLARGQQTLAKIERIRKSAEKAGEVKSAEKIGEVRRFLGYPENRWVTRALFSADDSRVVATGGEVRVWDAATGEIQAATKDLGFGWGLALSPDGRLAYQTVDSGIVLVWDLKSTEEVGQLQAPAKGPSELQLSADGKRLLISASGNHRLCEAPGGKQLGQFDAPTAALSPDGARVALLRGERIVFWDVGSGKETEGFDIGTGQSSLTFSGDGRLLATSSDSPKFSTVTVWDVATGKERSSFKVLQTERPVGGVRVAVSPDGRRILTGHHIMQKATNAPLILWDVATAKEVCRFPGPENGVFSLSFSHDGRSAVVTAGGPVRLLRLPDPPAKVERSEDAAGQIRIVHRVPLGRKPIAYPHQTAVSRDGQFFAADLDVEEVGARVVVWDGESGKEIHRFEGWRPDFLPDGKGLAYLTRDGPGVVVRDPATGKILSRVAEPEGLWGWVPLPDSRHVLQWTPKHQLELGDLESGKVVQAWPFAEDVDYAWTTDGRVLFVKPAGQTSYRCWDVRNNKPLDGYAGLVKHSQILSFLPGDKQAIVGEGGREYLADAGGGKRVAALPELPGPYVARACDRARCLSDGSIQLLGSADGKLRLFDRLTAKERASFQLPDGERIARDETVSLSADGRHACVETDRAVYLLRLPDPAPAKDKP